MQDVSDKLIRTDMLCSVSGLIRTESSIGEADIRFFTFSLSSEVGVEASVGEAGDCICLYGADLVNLRPSGISKVAQSFFRSVPLNPHSQG